ncbi:MAG: hypothetical protein M0018_03150 [Nitrospiraceae bacterium]|nr:hypothetical protein [Nitrospiraceae bacterium]
MASKRTSIALVLAKEGSDSAGNVKGIITPEEIGKARIESMELLAD